MARPTKFNEERSSRILKALSEGNSRRVSALLAGVDPDTLTHWMARYSGFSLKVSESEAAFEAGEVANVRKASRDRDWKASAWLLERRYPKEWGKREEIEHSGKIEMPVIGYRIVPPGSSAEEPDGS